MAGKLSILVPFKLRKSGKVNQVSGPIGSVGSSVFFPFKWKIFQNISIFENFAVPVLGGKSENSGNFQKNQRKWMEKSYCIRKTPKFLACGALKYTILKGFQFQNGRFWSKIAPEGREKNWGRKFFHFRKTKKKTLVTVNA